MLLSSRRARGYPGRGGPHSTATNKANSTVTNSGVEPCDRKRETLLAYLAGLLPPNPQTQGGTQNTYQTFTSPLREASKHLPTRPKHLPKHLNLVENTCAPQYPHARRLPRPGPGPISAPEPATAATYSHQRRALGRTQPYTPGYSGLYSF